MENSISGSGNFPPLYNLGLRLAILVRISSLLLVDRNNPSDWKREREIRWIGECVILFPIDKIVTYQKDNKIIQTALRGKLINNPPSTYVSPWANLHCSHQIGRLVLALIAFRIGKSGVVFTWQYSLWCLEILLAEINNFLPNWLYNSLNVRFSIACICF